MRRPVGYVHSANSNRAAVGVDRARDGRKQCGLPRPIRSEHDDEGSRLEGEIQKVTDEHVALVDAALKAKEAEIMEV